MNYTSWESVRQSSWRPISHKTFQRVPSAGEYKRRHYLTANSSGLLYEMCTKFYWGNLLERDHLEEHEGMEG
jgi:hypothetical protein